MRLALTLTLLALPGLAVAAGTGGDFDPPQPTETTETCDDGFVWDEAVEACVRPEEATEDENAMMRDVRELAYAARYADASRVLDRLDPADPWVLTYRGFLARKSGDLTAAREFYTAALAADPDHLLARSYMGQGFVEAGDLGAARDQLVEIRLRGGAGTWPEVSLTRAIDRGDGYSY